MFKSNENYKSPYAKKGIKLRIFTMQRKKKIQRKFLKKFKNLLEIKKI
jgi:hypothetical protein